MIDKVAVMHFAWRTLCISILATVACSTALDGFTGLEWWHSWNECKKLSKIFTAPLHLEFCSKKLGLPVVRPVCYSRSARSTPVELIIYTVSSLLRAFFKSGYHIPALICSSLKSSKNVHCGAFAKSLQGLIFQIIGSVSRYMIYDYWNIAMFTWTMLFVAISRKTSPTLPWNNITHLPSQSNEGER